MRDIMESRKKPMEIVDAKSLDMDEKRIGLNGSFTQVVKIFSPPIKEDCELIDGNEPINAAEKLFIFLKEKKII